MSQPNFPKINFIGKNATQVAGSMTLVEYQGVTILLDCGIAQGNSLHDDYVSNKQAFDKVKVSKLDYVFISHQHLDHIGLLPMLVSHGFNGRVIVPKELSKFILPLLLDGAYIMSKNAIHLGATKDKIIKPLYTEEDVYELMHYIEEYDFNKRITLNDRIDIQFFRAGHILLSSQIKIFFKEGEHYYTILYTGDLGKLNKSQINPWATRLKKIKSADIVIAESTYCDKDRADYEYTRSKEMQVLKNVVLHHRKVLIPVFSLSRTQIILETLYKLYGKDKSFKTKIYIDSPLASKMTDLYGQILKGDKKAYYDKMLRWDNIRFVNDRKHSQALRNDNRPMIILSSAGMLNAGRSRLWADILIPNAKDSIVFVGFTANNTYGYKVRNYLVPNIKCNITELHSFSSHIQYYEMLSYYTSINCQTVYLVHGNLENKQIFAKTLKAKFEKLNKSTKVVAVE